MPLQCTTLDTTSTTTGLQIVGAMNLFGSNLGDISLGLIERCQ